MLMGTPLLRLVALVEWWLVVIFWSAFATHGGCGTGTTITHHLIESDAPSTDRNGKPDAGNHPLHSPGGRREPGQTFFFGCTGWRWHPALIRLHRSTSAWLRPANMARMPSLIRCSRPFPSGAFRIPPCLSAEGILSSLDGPASPRFVRFDHCSLRDA